MFAGALEHPVARGECGGTYVPWSLATLGVFQAVLVHITITDPGLRDHQERLAVELRADGADVNVAAIDHVDADAGGADRVRHADALICLVGREASLCVDGTQRGESDVRAARAVGIPICAYEASTTPAARPSDHRAAYGAARLERLRGELRHTGTLTTVPDMDRLVHHVLDDVAATRATLQQVAPDTVRSLHRRLRTHPDVRYDAFSVSMHNMDHIYSVDAIVPNREMPATFRGREPGGAGANTIVGLSRLGVTTGVAGAVGDDPDGTELRRALEREQVADDLLLTVRDSAKGTGHAVVLRDPQGRHSNFVDAGVNDRLAVEIDRHGLRESVVDAVTRSKILHHSSFSTMSERKLQEQLLVHLPNQTVVTFKPGTMDAALGAERLASVLGRSDVLFVSEQEIDLLLERLPGFNGAAPLNDKLDRLFTWRSGRGYTDPLLVVMVFEDIAEDEPLYLYWGAERYEGGIGSDPQSSGQDTPEIIDPAGARDAAAAGVLFGLLRSRGPADCANLGYVLAMSVAVEYGCRRGLPRPPEVRDRWRRWLHVDEPPKWLDPYGQ